jgi:hypothetical protein
MVEMVTDPGLVVLVLTTCQAILFLCFAIEFAHMCWSTWMVFFRGFVVISIN